MSRLFTKNMCVVFAAVALLVLAGCSAAQQTANVESGAKKVVTFDGGEITHAEVQEQIDSFAQQSGAGGIPPDSPQYQAALQQVMPQLLASKIAKAYAEEQGITVSEKDVDGEIEEIKKQIAQQAEAAGQDVSKEEAFEQALEQANYTEKRLRQDIREGLPIQKVQEEVGGGAEPTGEEVRAYYEENKELQFTTPEQRCTRHILFNKDQEKLAQDVKQRLEDGGDFAELAKKYSQDPGSKEKGGDLGCQGEGSFVPAFEKAVFGADEGEILGPVETEFGYHVIEVTEIRPEEAAPLEEVAPQIKDQLTQEQQSQKFQEWVEEQKEKRNVKYLPGYDPESTQGEQPEE